MAITYKGLKSKLRRALWVAPGEPANLVSAHNRFFDQAMIEIGKWCELNRLNNTQVVSACTTLVRCGLTVFDAPNGIIRKIYTIANDEWCDTVFYDSASYRDVLCWSRRLCDFVSPDNSGLPALQQGFRYADASSDSTHGRARVGMWAQDRRKIYVAPWVQSNEKVVIEWDGWKQKWNDDDVIDEDIWGEDVQEAIKLYVRWKHESDFGCDLQKKRDAQNDWEVALSELMYWDRKKREGQPMEDCTQRRIPTSTELADDAPPATPGATHFAIVGDYGDGSITSVQVADMVKGWQPEFIINTGDNWYGGSVERQDLDDKAGSLYHAYIKNYSGSYGVGAERDNFYPSIGDHDRDPLGRLDIVMDFFNFANFQPVASNEIRPFYSVVRGPLHIFVIDQGYDQDEVLQQSYGNSPSSAQAEWLRIGLLLSTARWKMVISGAVAYSSYHTSSTSSVFAGDGFRGYTALRWPYKQWGADVFIGGDIHWYERLRVDDFLHITNGAGGRVRVTQNGDLSEFSEFLYDEDYGAQNCTVDCNNLQMDFYSRTGELIDSVKLTKA